MNNPKVIAEHLLKACIELGRESSANAVSADLIGNLVSQVLDALSELISVSQEGILRDDCSELFERALRSCSASVPLVHCFADTFICHNSASHYQVSPNRTKAINQLARLIVPADPRMSSAVRDDVAVVAKDIKTKVCKLPYPPGFVVGKRWQAILNSLMVLVDAWDEPHLLATMAINKGPYFMEVPPLKPEDSENIRSYVSQLKSPLALAGESPAALVGTVTNCRGIPCSANLTIVGQIVDELISKSVFTGRPGTIIEIGSGYGRFARAFHLTKLSKCYVLVNLAESLLFAYASLAFSCPTAKLLFIKTPEDITPTIEEDYDFIFCPVQNFSHLKLSDVSLALNIYSFGEMPQRCVDFLTRNIEDNCTPRYFYTRNTFFTNRDALVEACLNTTEPDASQVTLNVRPMFEPVDFSIHSHSTSATDGQQATRTHAFTLLRRVAKEPSIVINEAIARSLELPSGSNMWLIQAFLAALWTDNQYYIRDFLLGFKRWTEVIGLTSLPRFKFDDVSEVRYLRNRLRSLESGKSGNMIEKIHESQEVEKHGPALELKQVETAARCIQTN